MHESHRPLRYAVVVPVKPPAVGKSRLLGVADRRGLAEAFALDTVAACLDADLVGRVLVVTDDAGFSAHLAAMGASVIPDGVSDDLNGTLRQGAAEAHLRWPDLATAALCADLPALRAVDLDEVLARGTAEPWFVPDSAGIGTTLYAAAYDAFEPRFGPDSRQAHLDTGAREVANAPASVRRDVDDAADLADAIRLGVGRHTRLLT